MQNTYLIAEHSGFIKYALNKLLTLANIMELAHFKGYFLSGWLGFMAYQTL